MDTLENCRLRVNGGARGSQNKICLQNDRDFGAKRESGLGEEEVGQGPLGRENGICKCGRPVSHPSSWGEPHPRDRVASRLSLSDPVILNPIWVPRAGAAYGAGREGSPVAVMPDPRVAAVLGSEVRLAIVVDLGGEAQEPPVARGGVGVGGRGREAVLLHGALKHEHGPVLQVGALLHDLCVEDQVGGSWEGRHRIQTRPETPHPFLSRFRLIPELALASIPARASLSRTGSWCPPSRSPSLWIAAPNSSPFSESPPGRLCRSQCMYAKYGQLFNVGNGCTRLRYIIFSPSEWLEIFHNKKHYKNNEIVLCRERTLLV